MLSLLNGYLSEAFGITRETPNRYIFRLALYLNAQKAEGKTVHFYKADISAFYDNINHSVLTKYLAPKIDASALKLVLNAITVPTLSYGEKPGNGMNIRGVPQGLSISNILAELYFEGAHKQLNNAFKDALFLRYVDDILIADTEQRDFEGILTSAISNHNLGLSLSPNKTQAGIVGVDSFDFIGYRIKGDVFSIKESNKNRYADRLVRRCHQIRNQSEDPTMRPRYIKNPDEFLDFAKTDLNFLLSGFKVNNHNYGWIAYFQQMNDLKILYQFDRLVKKSLGKDLYDKLHVNSMVRTYHDLRENMGRTILIDFDRVTDRGAKLGYLKKFGYLKASDFTDLTDEEVDQRFKILIQSFIKSSEVNVGEIS